MECTVEDSASEQEQQSIRGNVDNRVWGKLFKLELVCVRVYVCVRDRESTHLCVTSFKSFQLPTDSLRNQALCW